MEIRIHTDASVPAPDRTGQGVVIFLNGALLATIAAAAEPELPTQAEFSAVLTALRVALLLNAGAVVLQTDAQAVADVLNRDQPPGMQLRPLWRTFRRLRKRLGGCEVVWVPREENTAADTLAGQASGREAHNFR